MLNPAFGSSDTMPSRRNLLRSGAAAWLFSQLPGARGAESSRFAVVPYLPARRLVGYYSPLLPVLAGSLGRPAEITCAHDYRDHLDRLRTGHFDVVADSLFIARIAQRELGHVPIARTLARLEPLLVVPSTSGLRRLAELKGQHLCVTDRIAALSLVGLRYLRDQGLAPDQQVHILVSGSHANSLHRLLAGDAAAAIVSRTTLKQVDADLARQVRVLAVLPSALAAVVYHVAPHLAPQAAALSLALLDFANQTAPGHQFIEALGHQGLAIMTPAELHSLDPMVVEFYRQLAVPD
jgi:ABC-type phosphate/phosphonate transport system substrate-binding protein